MEVTMMLEFTAKVRDKRAAQLLGRSQVVVKSTLGKAANGCVWLFLLFQG